jgi:micrococcal nuclease
VRRLLGALLLAAAVIAIVLFAPALVQRLSPTPVAAAGIPDGATPATVDYVHDGDTLFLADGRKVRLLGIDTPEIGEHAECWGEEATTILRELLPQGTSVWVLPDIEPLDQYGRSLLFVYTDDATNINLAMLERGAAEVEQYAPNLLLQAELEGAMSTARAGAVGMWGAC